MAARIVRAMHHQLCSSVRIQRGVRQLSSQGTPFLEEYLTKLDQVIPSVDKSTSNKAKGGSKGKGKDKGKGKGKGGSPFDAELRKYAMKLRRADKPSDVTSTLDELIQSTLKHNIYHYSAAFHRLRDFKRWNACMRIFDLFTEDASILNLVEPNNHNDVAGYMDEALTERRIQYRLLYNAGLGVCGKSGDWKKAIEMVDSMRNWTSKTASQADWMKPDGLNYASVFKACARAKPNCEYEGQVSSNAGKTEGMSPCDAALGLFGLMKERGDEIHPYSYHAIIGIFFNTTQKQLFLHTPTFSITANHLTFFFIFNCFIQFFCSYRLKSTYTNT